MTRTEKVKELKAYVGGRPFMTRAEFAKCLGVSPSNADRRLRGVEKAYGKYYFIKDIVEKMEVEVR